MKNDIIKHIKPVNPSISKLNFGKSINIEPNVKKKKKKNVGVWNLSKRYFISFIQIKDPKINPIPKGIRKGKNKLEIEIRYAS